MLSTDLLFFYRQVSHQALTVVDVETTGCHPNSSRVIEISVLQATLKSGIHHQQTHLINPQVPVPESITRFTGISQDMVAQAPLAEDVWKSYLPLLNSGTLTAHNLAFDYGFLQSEFHHLGICFTRSNAEQLCTVILARLMLPDLPSRSLPNLVQHFGFPVNTSHRAEADTLACWLLTKLLLTEIQNEPDEILLDRFAKQWLSLRDAAAILGVSTQQARASLKLANVKLRLVGQYQTPQYQRGDVERLFRENQGSNQLSLLQDF
ncbi:3'-5' exonuclease [Phormidium sp. CLA17]|uniref:3'-5' exonuclease n=1 Tax=Leptolyngbya sp. Cla-17 TaxID=2803751 RepID=UPI001490D57B|nr:3'-5' exonuclease [Leptolyngbya sp. Cla-17]MBM0742386.1 3'-5' exonuclease [Leptolyngbya sp. Cla-17]